MNVDILAKTHELKAQGQPFVIATVVRAERPTSARPGASAVITAGGGLEGWIGGSCAEPTVRREARKALEDGQPRLVRLCPPEKRGTMPQEGVTEITMTCISGGTLEIFIEPVLAPPHLVVVGHLPIARALTNLGKGLGFQITLMGLEAPPERFAAAHRVIDTLDFSGLEIGPDAYIVVASHGNYDEDALAAALRTRASYVALVASRARAEAMLEYLRDSGLTEENLTRLKYPAGLDLGAITPEEIALSILAEIVQLRRKGVAPRAQLDSLVQIKLPPAEAIDPVCGMTVEIASARYVTHYNGQTYYFCAKGCQRSFEAEPEKFVKPVEAG
jgi:xanthine dehydrogenase accessory factor